jgi:hypothetical protein
MKTHDEIIELMHREIDGLNSADESARLSELLKEHSAYAQMYDELRDLSTMLDAVEDLTPRKHLAARIMKSVEELSASRHESRSALEFVRSLNLRPVMTFAAGVALGCVLIVSLSTYAGDSSADAKHLLGAFVDRNLLDEMETVGITSMKGEGVDGSVTATRSENMILVNVNVRASGESTLRMKYDANELRFKGFVDVKNGSSTAASVGTGEIRCTFSGDHAYAVIFDITSPRTSALGVEVMSGDRIVLEQSIATALPGAYQ